MGHTVVFTVPLDPDDEVGIETRRRGPAFRDEFAAQWADVRAARRWRWVLGTVAVLPLAVAALLHAGGVHLWFGAAVVASAALAVLAASGALGGSVRRGMPEGAPRRERWGITTARMAALWVGGALVTTATGPALAWVAVREKLTERQLTPLVVAILIAACAAVSLGAALAGARRWGHPLAVGAAASVALALLPMALFGASIPVVSTTDRVQWYTFTTGVRDPNGLSLPAYQCATETVSRHRAHTERSAWLLMVSPLASIADAPVTSAKALANAEPGSLTLVQAGLRSTRVGPDAFSGYCYQPTSLGVPNAVREARYERAQPLGMTVALGELAAFTFAALALLSRRRRS